MTCGFPLWRSVRATDDTKTEKSRRTLELPPDVVQTLKAHRVAQAEDRLAAGMLWQDLDLVFCTSVGTALDAANVRRQFRAVVKASGIPLPVRADGSAGTWTPRELRHSFVSLMSANGVSIEEISRLVGHAGTTVTEAVYRHELRPVLTKGAEVMGRSFSQG